VFNYPRLFDFAAKKNEWFKKSMPFPHIVLDGFLPPDYLALAIKGCPPVDSDFWRRTDNEHTHHKLTPDGAFGTQITKELRFPEEARRVFYELNCGLFLLFLRLLTGIDKLIADPYFIEGGYHCVGDEGRLGVHADFSHHSYLGFERRLNLLLYLNEDWKPEYGGALKLYAEDMTSTQPIYPIANRCVIFETSEKSFHGHPEPMNLPEGVWRRSIALYYYTMPRPERAERKAIFPKPRIAGST
jgi:hypothetical protein